MRSLSVGMSSRLRVGRGVRRWLAVHTQGKKRQQKERGESEHTHFLSGVYPLYQAWT